MNCYGNCLTISGDVLRVILFLVCKFKLIDKVCAVMMKISVLIALLLLNLIATCSSVKVQMDYDPSAHFSDLQSYRWLRVDSDMPRPEYQQIDSESLFELVHESADDLMKSKGFRLTVDQLPDFYLTYYAGIKGSLNVDDYGYSYGTNYGGLYDRYADLQGYQEGILILDVIRADDMELIWRGWGRAAIQDPAEAQQKVKEAVKKILEKFPPEIEN